MVRAFFVVSVSALQLEEYFAFRLPACFSNFSALVCILIRDSCASAFVRSIFRSVSNCICCRNSLSCISSIALQFRSVTITLGSSRCASSISFLCCVNISCVVILRSVSKFGLHIFFQVFFHVQLAVTALAPLRRDVGNVLAAVCPCSVVTSERSSTRNSSRFPAQRIHSSITRISSNFQLSPGCRVVFRVGHSARLPLALPSGISAVPVLHRFGHCERAAPESVHPPYVLSGLEVHTVDDAVRVNVFPVGVGADEHFAAVKYPASCVLLRAPCAGRRLHLSGNFAPCGKTSRRRPCGAAASYSGTRRTRFPADSQYR